MDFSVVHNDSHPLLLLISDLKSSLNATQNDAHSSSVRLLRHSLSTSQALERTHALQHENSVLNKELQALRSLFLPNKSPEADRQSINQLTLSLRTLNEKLTATEILLASRTAELTHALGELQQSKSAADTTRQLLVCAQRRQETFRSRESELELKARTAEERARMTDRAIGEYANLVRTLQGHAIKGEDAHVHVSSHEDLLRQFSQERESLQNQLSSAQTDLALLSSENTALSKSTQITLAELKDLRMKLQLYERDDATATKMVARYMKFSQTQMTQLQTSLSTLSTRHAATLSSLTAQIQSLTHALTLTQSHNERLLSALDNLGNEVMKEAHGRRREVRLRIKLVGREERVLEGLRRWLRRAEEGHAKLCATDEGARTVLVEMIQDAKILIDNLDDPLLLHSQQLSQGVRPPPVSGSLARLFTIQSMIDDLVEDIQREQTKRIALEKMVIRQEVDVLVDREEVDEKVDLSQLSSKDHNVRIVSSASINPECLLDGVADPILSPTLQIADHAINSRGPALVNTSTSPITSTTPLPATPIIKITPPPPTSPFFTDHGSEAEETKSESEDDSMSLEREDDGNQIVGDVYGNVDGGEGGIPKDLFSVGSGALPVDTGVEELDARAILPANVSDNETAASKPMEETTPDESQMVSENDDTDIQPSDNDMLSSNEMTTLVHPQPRSTPALPLLVSSSPSPPPNQLPTRLPEPSAPHPLLDDLSKARNRYDNLQRSFHACHVAMEGLKASFPFTDTNNSSSAFDVHPQCPSTNGGDFPSSSSAAISNDVLKAIVQRLDDYTEDARVELEIRISDEEVMGRGYEALLMLPGALSSTVFPSFPVPDDEKGGDGIISGTGMVIDTETQMRAFIDGTDPMISRAMGSFKKKLEDIEHDVVIVKKVLHDPSSLFPSSPSTKTMMEPPSSTLDDSRGTGWSSWIRTPISRPSTPVPVPALTFGSIMTSRNTMLRRTAATFGLSSGSRTKSTDVVNLLGLKVPMPDFDLNLHASSGSMRDGGGGGDDDDGQSYDEASGGVNMRKFGGLGLGCALDVPRSRTISTSMYMLGMGVGRPGVVGTGKRSFSTPLGGGEVPVAMPWSAGREGKGSSASENGNGSSSSISRPALEDEDVD